jgi:hypothetical protein
MLAGRYYVSNVTPDGPIVKAGIAVNDVLMKIDDEDVLGKALDEVEEILKVSFPVHPLCPDFCPFFPILIASLASPSPFLSTCIPPQGPPDSSVDLQFYRNHMSGFVRLKTTVARRVD